MEVINNITVRGVKVSCLHNNEQTAIKLSFAKGSYAFDSHREAVKIILSEREALDLINMLTTHYEAISSRYEQFYREGQ